MIKQHAIIGAVGALFGVMVAGQAWADGNRYDYDRAYQSEISVSEAYLAMEHSKGWDKKAKKGQPKPVLIDVRSLREYASGHPEGAHNVPFPNIYMSNDQSPQLLYDEVYAIVKGRLDTPIMLLCRTGSRSVRAGNYLADPDNLAEDPLRSPIYGAPFTNVRNIWEGFVGLYRYGFANGVPDPTNPLDLDNDGAIGPDAADVYLETKDYNPDKDGWRNFAALPWTTDIRRPLSYLQDPGLYDALNLTPVP